MSESLRVTGTENEVETSQDGEREGEKESGRERESMIKLALCSLLDRNVTTVHSCVWTNTKI